MSLINLKVMVLYTKFQERNKVGSCKKIKIKVLTPFILWKETDGLVYTYLYLN